jgi:hypothetical protein
LNEIHTAPHPPSLSAVLSGEQIVELARLRDFLSLDGFPPRLIGGIK